MVIEDTLFILWLMIAGPLWATVGLFVLPGVNEGRAKEEQISKTTLQIAGVIGGFALGPIGVALLYFEPAMIRRTSMMVGVIVTVFATSQVLVRVVDPDLPSALWLVLAGPLWAAIAAYILPRHYRELEADDQNVLTAAALGGFAIGPLIIGLMWKSTPKINRDWMITLGSLGAWQIYTLFAIQNPDNPCVQAPFSLTYLTQQTANGVVIGCIYSLMAVGLTLIYSVQGIVSFAHGQLYMVGGYFSFYFLLHGANVLSDFTGTEVSINPIWGIPVAAVIVFVMGALFERTFLKPMHEGLIERVSEYAILITFGFGFVIEYTTLAVAGPFPQRTDRFIEIRRFTLQRTAITEDFAFGSDQHHRRPRLRDGCRDCANICAALFLAAHLDRPRFARNQPGPAGGRGNRHQPHQYEYPVLRAGLHAGGHVGRRLDPDFRLGALGGRGNGRSFLCDCGAGRPGFSARRAVRRHHRRHCRGPLAPVATPDPSRGAAYKEAFALVIFALVLLLKPTGLFGREHS